MFFTVSYVQVLLHNGACDIMVDEVLVILDWKQTVDTKPTFVEPNKIFVCREKFHLLELYGNTSSAVEQQ